jgi:hypothetical protein
LSRAWHTCKCGKCRLIGWIQKDRRVFIAEVDTFSKFTGKQLFYYDSDKQAFFLKKIKIFFGIKTQMKNTYKAWIIDLEGVILVNDPVALKPSIFDETYPDHACDNQRMFGSQHSKAAQVQISSAHPPPPPRTTQWHTCVSFTPNAACKTCDSSP